MIPDSSIVAMLLILYFSAGAFVWLWMEREKFIARMNRREFEATTFQSICVVLFIVPILILTVVEYVLDWIGEKL